MLMKTHKEGRFILLSSLLGFILISLITWKIIGLNGLYISILVVIPIYIFLLRFFRVPTRQHIINPNAVISPCDGTIVAIEEVEEPENLKGKCIQVSIFMSVWNVHINWYPVMGRVAYYKYHPGKFLVAWHPKSSTENERTTVTIERPDGVKVLLRQIAGLLARRIICYSHEGEQAAQGKELGFIKFGSRVDLFLPLNSDIKVNLKQKVTGTQTVIAEIPVRE
jgi:phosphatidylserine decarboxylase